MGEGEIVNDELGEYIEMPNHVHGIIIIDNDPSVETRHALSLRVVYR